MKQTYVNILRSLGACDGGQYEFRKHRNLRAAFAKANPGRLRWIARKLGLVTKTQRYIDAVSKVKASAAYSCAGDCGICTRYKKMLPEYKRRVATLKEPTFKMLVKAFLKSGRK